MKYKDYDIENFISDEFFVQWVKNPSENNRHFWEKWLEQHPDKRFVVYEAANFIRSINYNINPDLPDKVYVDMYENILKFDEAKPVNKAGRNSGGFFYLFPVKSIAASILLMFCLWIQYEAINFRTENEEEIQIAIISKSNPVGQKSIIDLPDGSRVHLNSESEIEFPASFSEDKRWVTLKGEAFFEIQKESRPFYVESGLTSIHVMGTTFNVNQSENGSLYVALVTGKVRVNSKEGEEVDLEPKEMLVIEQSGTYYKTGFDPLDIIAWKDKTLVFKSASLREIKSKLEKWYGVQVEFKGVFDNNWTYSGIYEDEMLENVLRGICLTSGMKFSIENKKITITNPK
ncbi:FecR family protein [Cognataquiflexum rubidum]|uniref:FecR family protein n=1 Tax=Cognataquiflexum rubidum TaxID=2922273 RepID=UPI001F12CDFE|nr:FecR family protein [Cognataquiflexum rubidum]MCH6233164.1 FecR domain-containing protein [Cognataquiflexum rubidum]